MTPEAFAALTDTSDFRERKRMTREYMDAATAVQQCRIQIDTWERRERDARTRLRKLADEFEFKGWMLP
jgi:hypothetical protein